MRNLLYKDEDFTVEWEEMEDCLFLHCEVKYWKLSAFRRMYKVFAELQDVARQKGFSSLATITPNPRFAKLFGGETVSTLTKEGIEYEVVVWELKQGHLPHMLRLLQQQ